MANDTMVTVQGWLGSDPVVRQVNGTPVASFRVGCTPRRYSRAREAWVEGQTQWYQVSAWRALGEHCGRSLRTGDPVLLHGRLTTRPWVNRAGVEVLSLEIEAVSVGHDLGRGVSVFTKTLGTPRAERAEPPAPSAPTASPASPVPGVPGAPGGPGEPGEQSVTAA